MVDAGDLKSSAREGVRVRVPPSAPAARPRLGKKPPTKAYRLAGVPIIARRWIAPRPRADDDREIIRAAFAEHYWHVRNEEDRKLLLRVWLLWPFLLVGMMWRFTRLNGPTVAARYGRPIALQLYDQLRFFFRFGILPRWYYIFSLYEPAIARQAHSFLNRYEMKRGLYGLLNRSGSSPLNDKHGFAAQCRAHGIPTAPIFLKVIGGEIRWEEAAGQLPACDLFVKPTDARGGCGAERWDFAGEGTYRSIAGETLTAAELLDRWREQSRTTPLLVQRRLRNHPDVADLSNGALCTVRIMTFLDEQGEPEVVAAALRMAIGRNVTIDNIHAGGIAVEVDIETGELSRASDLGDDVRLGWLDTHPDTGAPIAGRRLAGWSEARALALRAHRDFSDRTVVGWDIALTPEGPVVIEGNSGPCVDILQRMQRRGLGDQRFGHLLAFHLVERGLTRVREQNLRP
jgi:putative polysaccharide biosynthesis protein